MDEQMQAQAANTAPEAETNTAAPKVEVHQNGSTMTAEIIKTDPAAEPEEKPEEKPEVKDTDIPEVETELKNQQQTEADVSKSLADKGVNFDDLAKEYDQNGELSPESITKLDKAGYPKSVVDAYLNGLQAMTDRFVTSVKQMAGGDDAYKQLADYIKTQPKGIVDGFNASIKSGNMSQIQLTIAGLKAQMVQSYGTNNPTIMAGAMGTNNPQGYTSSAQMVKDMSDPRYQHDPSFTREVLGKVKNATFF